MKKLLLLILFVLNLVLLHAQKVEFISVNGADASLQNINFKRLPKLLEKESLTADTLATPTKWMVKLSKKLTRKQRRDSNIYIFFCPNNQDSIKAYLPLSGKYGYVLFDTAKTGVEELERLQFRLSTWKYQWDFIHNPEGGFFLFQDVEEGELIQNLTEIVNVEKENLPVKTGSASFFTPAGLPIYFADMSKMEEMYFTLKTVDENVSLEKGIEVVNLIVADRGVLVAFKYDNEFYTPIIEVASDAIIGTIRASDHVFKGYLSEEYYIEPEHQVSESTTVYWYDKNYDGFWNPVTFCYNYKNYINGMAFNSDGYKGAGYYATYMERRTGYSCDNYIATLKDLDNLDFFNDALWVKYNPWDKGGLLQKIEDREGEIRLVYSISETIGVVKYSEYDYVIEDWVEIDLQSAGLTSYLDIDFLADVAQEFGHTTLDVVGFIPVVGEASDVVNGLWYLLEDEGGQATLCFASMIPVFGDMAAKTTKYTIKAIKAKKLAKTFELTGEAIEHLGAISSLLKTGNKIACEDCLNLFAKLLEEFPEHGSALTSLASKITDTDNLVTVLTKLDKWAPDELTSLYSKLDKYPDLASELKNEKLFEAVETIVKDSENAWDALRDLKDADVVSETVSRIGKSSFFTEVVGKGRAFEQNVLNDIVEGFSSGSGKAYDAVKDKLQLLGKQIDDYVVYSQVQLDVPGGKMVADQVLVKYDMLGEIEDVVVLENKLKDVTDYTTRQKSGWGQINSHKSLTVRSSAAEDKLGKGLELVQGNSLPVSNVIRIDGILSGEFNDVRAVIEDLTKY